MKLNDEIIFMLIKYYQDASLNAKLQLIKYHDSIGLPKLKMSTLLNRTRDKNRNSSIRVSLSSTSFPTLILQTDVDTDIAERETTKEREDIDETVTIIENVQEYVDTSTLWYTIDTITPEFRVFTNNGDIYLIPNPFMSSVLFNPDKVTEICSFPFTNAVCLQKWKKYCVWLRNRFPEYYASATECSCIDMQPWIDKTLPGIENDVDAPTLNIIKARGACLSNDCKKYTKTSSNVFPIVHARDTCKNSTSVLCNTLLNASKKPISETRSIIHTPELNITQTCESVQYKNECANDGDCPSEYNCVDGKCVFKCNRDTACMPGNYCNPVNNTCKSLASLKTPNDKTASETDTPNNDPPPAPAAVDSELKSNTKPIIIFLIILSCIAVLAIILLLLFG